MELKPEKDVYIHIKIHQLIKIEDLFDDNTCLKRTLRGGINSEQPETTCKVYMNFSINTLSGKLVYESGPVKYFKKSEVKSDNVDDLKEIGMKFYLDEFAVSQMMFELIKSMKKREICEVFVYDLKYINYGKDFEAISKSGFQPS